MISHSMAKAYTRAAVLLVLTALWAACSFTPQQTDPIAHAFEHHQRDVGVEGQGIVDRILPDDNAGSRHQRFIVRLASGQTVMIQHNIDVAPRIDDLNVGDAVGFSGEYVWNEQGGLIHWTHHDPAGRHVAGWVKHKGRTFQ